MSGPNSQSPDKQQGGESLFADLIQGPTSDSGAPFTVGFRGYDRAEVDKKLADLNGRLKHAQSDLAAAESSRQEQIDKLQAQLDQLSVSAQDAQHLQDRLSAKAAKLAAAEEQIEALSAQLIAEPAGDGESDEDNPDTRGQFEAVLRVAEDQANSIIQNAVVQAERLLETAREEVTAQRAETQADASRILEQAQHDADQIHLRIDTEYTAHEATIQREAAHAAEKLARAEREADTLRTEAEKGAAALRATVTRETEQLRADAERAVREMNARVLEFEETLTRRQNDAQQEFLVLHNQAVAHAERITSDANDQVASSLEHAQLISAKADDYEKLMRAQAAQIEAEAHVRAQETMERARTKAQKMVNSVTEHTTMVLRDAEDRARHLRWQQQQLTSFMGEVRELMRPDGVFSDTSAGPAENSDPKVVEAPTSDPDQDALADDGSESTEEK